MFPFTFILLRTVNNRHSCCCVVIISSVHFINNKFVILLQGAASRSLLYAPRHKLCTAVNNHFALLPVPITSSATAGLRSSLQVSHMFFIESRGSHYNRDPSHSCQSHALLSHFTPRIVQQLVSTQQHIIGPYASPCLAHPDYRSYPNPRHVCLFSLPLFCDFETKF